MLKSIVRFIRARNLAKIEHLTVYKTSYPKARVGRDHDGGYVICELPGSYDAFISGGIANDISFEEYFLNLHPELVCYAFDGTVSELPGAHRHIVFIRKNVGAVNDANTTNLHEYLERHENVFLKLDIEGHEFRLLPKLIGKYMERIKQLVIEIHTPADIRLHPHHFSGLRDITHRAMFKLLSDLNRTHTLVHLHANNGCKTHRVYGVLLPDVFESTYIRNDYVSEKVKNDVPLPTALDMPNIPDKPDIHLSGFPYSTSNGSGNVGSRRC